MLKGEWEGRSWEKIKVLQGPERTRDCVLGGVGGIFQEDWGLKGKTQMETLVCEAASPEGALSWGTKGISQGRDVSIWGRKDWVTE